MASVWSGRMRGNGLHMITLAAALCVPAAAWANPDTTHPLKFSGGSVFEFFGTLEKAKVSARHIIRLAQGLDVDVRPPKNEILALTVDCASGDAQLVVWDTATDMPIVAVSGSFSTTDDIAVQYKDVDPSKAVSIGQFDWNALGNATFGITGGTIGFAATIKYGDESGTVCPSKINIALLGTLDIVVAGSPLSLLMNKGKARASRPVHIAP